jgi:hypothetical protein
MLSRTWCRAAVVVAFGVLALPVQSAPQGYRLQGISPIFDGWEELPDGSRLFYFGYINRNSTDVNVPVSADNGFAPQPVDRGQPTTFLPGRHEHVFTVSAPANMQGKLVWTVKSEMGLQTANATFDQLYMLEQRENADPNAKPPVITVANVTARVNEAVTITPAVKPATNSGRVDVEGAAAEASGLNVTWSKYRGAGAVAFSRDPKAPAASAAPPAGGRAGRAAQPRPGIFPVACGQKPSPDCGTVIAKFSEPGDYLLRAAARQDGLEARAFVRVTVRP